MDTLMNLRLRLIAGLAISLAPAVVNAKSVSRRVPIPVSETLADCHGRKTASSVSRNRAN